MSKTYPVHETFHTFQGEGVHIGRPAYFIRLYGCPIHCPWCDSAGTWHPTWTPAGIDRLTAEQLAADAGGSLSPVVVITGGEPCIHDLEPLITACHKVGLKVHIETSGAFPITGEPDWVTLSPKKWKPPIEESLFKANEIKIIVEEPSDIPLYSELLMLNKYSYDHVWLHPEWSKRESPAVLNAISDAVKYGMRTFRAGWQIHKLYSVDSLDPNSRPLVPLGGEEERGY